MSHLGPDPRPGLTHADADWSGLRVLVTGLGISGFAAADALAERGAVVRVIDAAQTPVVLDRAGLLEVLGVDTRLGPDAVTDRGELDAIDLVVTSPGWRPDQPLLAAARAADLPVWGEVELAWRMRRTQAPAEWLTVTGTNGKTTTVKMLASMLTAAGVRATSAGNVGTPLLEAVLHPQPYQVLAVELSSFQLYWQNSISPLASACLNLAPDHIDWHGSWQNYRDAKARVYENTRVACVYNVQDPVTEQMVMDAEVIEGCRAIGVTRGIPAISMLGVVEDVLADRAFVAQRQTSAAELGTFADLAPAGQAPPAHYLSNALTAAALARAYGIAPVAVREGLRRFRPDPHRIAELEPVAGVRFVDDSKATNPHAAAASLAAYAHVVWIAGGLLKGADVEPLVQQHAERLRAVVLIGQDRQLIAQALARHASEVPVVEIAETDTGVMDRVVEEAARRATQGDVVLLAPAAASMDMFTDYGARGDAFAEAVRRYADKRTGPT